MDRSYKIERALTFIATIVLAVITFCCFTKADEFEDVKNGIKKLNKPYYFTEAVLNEGKTKSRVLIVFVDAPVPEWQVSYHKDHILVLLRPSLVRSAAFERWASYE